MSLGFSGGAAPPGAPSAERGNWAIIGGTGAYFGASGGGTGGAGRAASMSEDPAHRRINGGTAFPFQLHVIPMVLPTLAATNGTPAVTHSADFSLVTPANPAAPNELLSLFVTGLVPAIESPSTPFSANPLTTVSSPVSVSVNNESAQVLAAVGLPGSTSLYQVNIRVPGDITPGTTPLQVTSAWIPGPAVNISVAAPK